MRALFILVFFSLSTVTAFAQADSVKILTLQTLLEQALETHPVIKQANLLSERGRMQIRLAKGFFDPKLESQYSIKETESTKKSGDEDVPTVDGDFIPNFRKWNSYVKVPLWVGEFKAGFEQNTGDKLSGENTTFEGEGFGFAGFEIPLLQGMFIDKRRALLRESQAMAFENEAKRVEKINKLILQIAKDYWEWYFAYNQYLLTERGYKLAEFRYRAVVNQAKQGAMAAIDTTEAQINMQERGISRQEARLGLKNARLQLSNHLWSPEGFPLELNDEVIPVEEPTAQLATVSLEELMMQAQTIHPELKQLEAKLEQIDVRRRLAAELLKPTLNVNYYLLARSPFDESSYERENFEKNFKAGATFSFPLFLRKERGKLQLTKIKVMETELKRKETARRIENDLMAQYNELINLQRVLEMQQQATENYRVLMRGETQKFMQGMSSVFYMNVREGKLLEAETKLFKVKASLAKSYYMLRWSAGMGI
ncbi:TolC family protein [Algivirga pacifica]|uniref:TolC family protein n=1 Tax=Algivirga pacifica TaxID=1162670 RepID=A0ABP9DKT0_9BACT